MQTGIRTLQRYSRDEVRRVLSRPLNAYREDGSQKLATPWAKQADREPQGITVAAVTDPSAISRRQIPTYAPGNPKASAQRSYSDPDSHSLKGSGGLIQGYNAQARRRWQPPGDRGHRCQHPGQRCCALAANDGAHQGQYRKVTNPAYR